MAERILAIGITLLIALVVLGPVYLIETGKTVVDAGVQSYNAVEQAKKGADDAEQMLVNTAYEIAPSNESKQVIQQLNNTMATAKKLEDVADNLKTIKKIGDVIDGGN